MDEKEREKMLSNAIGKYSDALFRVSIAYVRNRQDAEDVLQEVFWKFYESGSKKKFNGDEHVKAWLIRVTIRKSINVAKYNARHRTVEMQDVFPAEATEEEREIESVLEKLSPIDREVVYLYYYEGYSVKEIAAMLRKSRQSVFKRLSRARQELKDYLSERR